MEERKIRGADRLVAPLIRWVPKWVKPNHLSAARAAMLAPIVAFLWQDLNALATISFITAVLLDIFDGTLARARGEQGATGEWLDAYADKVLVVGLLSIYGWGRFPTALIVLVIAAEFCLIVGRPLKVRRGKSGKANVFGKIKMWCQSLAILGLIIGTEWALRVSNILLWTALGFAFASIVWHVRETFRDGGYAD